MLIGQTKTLVIDHQSYFDIQSGRTFLTQRTLVFLTVPQIETTRSETLLCLITISGMLRSLTEPSISTFKPNSTEGVPVEGNIDLIATTLNYGT